MKYRPLLRALLASAVITAGAMLAGCDTDSLGLPSGRAMAPLSDKMLAEIEAKNMTKESPILVRLFKEESELEVWKQDNTGRFELLKTYPICRWSGELGPKIKLGDRQAPEGFYMIAPGQMNPNSNYYLAINTGFPNTYDRANGRTGEFLMIHGDCSSAGCYAMTDEQIAEIYALARESFLGGQRAFQIQAYPFRMTPLNMAKHRDSPHMAFWKMIKEGYDHFEVTHQEPRVDVCDKHYVFDAAAPNHSPAPLHFNPTAKCPAYEVPKEIAVPVAELQQREESQVAQLVAHNTPTVPVRTGTDGGMNPVFMAAVQAQGGTTFAIHSSSGTIPANIRPPGTPAPAETAPSTMSLASAESRPAPAPSAPASSGSGNLFSGLFSSSGDGGKASDSAKAADKASPNSSSGGGVLSRLFSGSSDQGSPETTATTKPKPPAAKPVQTATAATPTARPKPAATAAQGEPKSANATATKPANTTATKPPAAASATATDTEQEAVTTANLLRGAAATVPSGSFDSRWGTMH